MSTDASPAQQLTPTIGVEEAARLLRCHPDTLRRMAKAGEVPGTKVGRSWVFFTERLLEWLDARCQSQQQARPRDPPPVSGSSALAAAIAAERKRRQALSRGKRDGE